MCGHACKQQAPQEYAGAPQAALRAPLLLGRHAPLVPEIRLQQAVALFELGFHKLSGHAVAARLCGGWMRGECEEQRVGAGEQATEASRSQAEGACPPAQPSPPQLACLVTLRRSEAMTLTHRSSSSPAALSSCLRFTCGFRGGVWGEGRRGAQRGTPPPRNVPCRTRQPLQSAPPTDTVEKRTLSLPMKSANSVLSPAWSTTRSQAGAHPVVAKSRHLSALVRAARLARSTSSSSSTPAQLVLERERRGECGRVGGREKNTGGGASRSALATLHAMQQ